MHKKLLYQARECIKEAHEEGLFNTGYYNFCGLCAISAKFLKQLYHKNGISVTLVEGIYDHISGHAWLEDENYIYDPTACQFGRRRFIIKKPNKKYKIINTDGKFRHWKNVQKPSQNKVNLLLKVYKNKYGKQSLSK